MHEDCFIPIHPSLGVTVRNNLWGRNLTQIGTFEDGKQQDVFSLDVESKIVRRKGLALSHRLDI